MTDNTETEINKEIKGIKIGNNYILGNDILNLVLYEYGYKQPSPKALKQAKDNKKELPKPSWGLMGKSYFRTVEQVLNYILNQQIIDTNIQEMTDFQKIVDKIEELRKDFNNFSDIVRLKEDTLEVIK